MIALIALIIHSPELSIMNLPITPKLNSSRRFLEKTLVAGNSHQRVEPNLSFTAINSPYDAGTRTIFLRSFLSPIRTAFHPLPHPIATCICAVRQNLKTALFYRDAVIFSRYQKGSQS
ncbi:hypothetical protein PUN28_010688 [Cardiocondyla obscurior]|uniref:Uncharacterized protein n=1 Tax=Cardiocondyla obscurior TaxID=286306 RepID=A0AAW2FJA4_9HYME